VRGERHQDVAGVRDGTIGEHALMLVCSNAAKLPTHMEANAQVHTSGSQRLPMLSKAVTKMRRKMAKAAAFGPAERNAETGVGAPW